MKNTVKLYECWETTGDGHWFSLEPAYNPTHPATGLQYDDYSSGEPQEYELPDGFEVAETVDGIPAIYDADGNFCGVAMRNGNPVLIYIGGIRFLKAVERYHVSWTIPGSGNIDGDDFTTYEEAKACFDRMCLDSGRDAKLVEMRKGDELVMSNA